MEHRMPLRLSPVLKQALWGGTRLADTYQMGNEGEQIAEAWLLTCREDGMSTILGGACDGMTLADYLAAYPDAVGTRVRTDRFPLLIKWIDAEKDLSIQIHPDDAYAAAHTSDLGKTEMWYIVDAAPDAAIIYGMKEDYSAAEIRRALENGTLERLMRYQPVKAGETYFIPAGLVHAIGKGILIAEIQQNSNTTYRVYDYNRRDADGKLRPLHIEQALAVLESTDTSQVSSRASSDPTVIADCPYFRVRKLELREETAMLNVGTDRFLHLMCLSGRALLTSGGIDYAVRPGDSYFIPAGCGDIALEAEEASLILSTP
ncbi:MAG: class I mannose-6-phosphate isomerase [Clostridia bacterium]|nr:class I mannose-6-phosphate isomerase [Clostridia bacterium]